MASEHSYTGHIQTPWSAQSDAASPSEALSRAANLQTSRRSSTSDDFDSKWRAKAGRMRASIACVRCRESKTKCVNDGLRSVCLSCKSAGRTCSYKPASPTRIPKAAMPRINKTKAGDDRQSRKRNHDLIEQRTTAASIRLQPRPEDALDYRVLTPSVWSELFDIFQIHYSADLSFLHPTAFTTPLRRALKTAAADFEPNIRPQGCDHLLLAFLALTARFHAKLVVRHSPEATLQPMLPSRYYAEAARNCMRSQHDGDFDKLDNIQSLLMLGVYYLGACEGTLSWVKLGSAIRSAQARFMHCQDDPEIRCRVHAFEATEASLTDVDVFIKEETERRTMWSCFLMDRFTSCTKYRPQTLNVDQLLIQLPASERAFAFAERVVTTMLIEQTQQFMDRAYANTNVRVETGDAEGLVSRYIRIVEIFSRVAQWSCAGGRRTETHPPWDERSTFSILNRACQHFNETLPRQHALTPINTQTHISLKTSTPYILIHVVYLLCQITLHREYVPYVPVRCSKPQGPVDPPLLKDLEHTMPSGWWHESAEQCFRSARQIVELAETCQEWNALPETPTLGFAVFTAAFTGVWCQAFPHMDIKRFMRGSPHLYGKDGSMASRKAVQIVEQMSTRLPLALTWSQKLTEFRDFFQDIKASFDRHRNADLTEDSTARRTSLKEGGEGGGLDEYKQIENVLQFESLSISDKLPGMLHASKSESGVAKTTNAAVLAATPANVSLRELNSGLSTSNNGSVGHGVTPRDATVRERFLVTNEAAQSYHTTSETDDKTSAFASPSVNTNPSSTAPIEPLCATHMMLPADPAQPHQSLYCLSHEMASYDQWPQYCGSMEVMPGASGYDTERPIDTALPISPALAQHEMLLSPDGSILHPVEQSWPVLQNQYLRPHHELVRADTNLTVESSAMLSPRSHLEALSHGGVVRQTPGETPLYLSRESHAGPNRAAAIMTSIYGYSP